MRRLILSLLMASTWIAFEPLQAAGGILQILGTWTLTIWHVDPRIAADAPEGWGVNFSLARTLSRRSVPFLRAGLPL